MILNFIYGNKNSLKENYVARDTIENIYEQEELLLHVFSCPK